MDRINRIYKIKAKKVIRVARNQEGKVSPYGYEENQSFQLCGQLLRGRKCVFCGSFKVVRTARGYVKCRRPECGRTKSLTRLKREIEILKGFYQLVHLPAGPGSARGCKVVSRVYQRLREVLFHLTELEAGRLKGEIELDEAYFGGRRKGAWARGRRQKRGFRAAGARWTGLHQGRSVGHGGGIDAPHQGRHPQRARCTTPTPFRATSRCNGTASTIRSVES